MDQSFGQLQLFIGHLNLGDENGQLILSLLTHLQLRVGSSMPVLPLPYGTYGPWVEQDWMTSVWWFTTQTHSQLEVENQWLHLPPQSRDESITWQCQ